MTRAKVSRELRAGRTKAEARRLRRDRQASEQAGQGHGDRVRGTVAMRNERPTYAQRIAQNETRKRRARSLADWALDVLRQMPKRDAPVEVVIEDDVR